MRDYHRIIVALQPAQTEPSLQHGQLLRLVLLAAIMAGLVLDEGFAKPPLQTWLNHLLQLLLFAGFIASKGITTRVNRTSARQTKPDWTERVFIAVGATAVVIATAFDAGGMRRLFELCVVVLLTTEMFYLHAAVARLLKRPALLLPMSFVTMIVIGTLLIKVPLATEPWVTLGWFDALFTMTSAVCVTGLIVRDTATTFTPLGQTIIGVFIQLGGLGIIVFGSLFAMLLGNRLSLRQNVSLSQMLSDQPLHRVTTLVRFIVATTLLFELVGGLLIAAFMPTDLPLHHRVGVGLFHAVSAYCNAGFTLFSDSFEGYRYSVMTHLIVLPLIVVGGLGFTVLSDVWRMVRHRVTNRRRQSIGRMRESYRPAPRLSLHSKIVLTTTVTLYLVGMTTIMIGQLKPHLDASLQQGVTANQTRPQPLNAHSVFRAALDSSFMSITARTAGFNTMPMDELSPAGRFTVIALMFVGASPGGTGGGMKTVTAALLIIAVIATVRRRDQAEAFGRRIAHKLVIRAGTIAACFILLVAACTWLLTLSEPYPFSKILFEAVSAASTTGLSMGITADLTTFGKCVIIVTMFLGRVGPLALLGSLVFGEKRTKPYAYAEEDVIMG